MSKLKILGLSTLVGFGLEAGKLLFIGGSTYLGATKGAKKLGEKACECFIDGLAGAFDKIANDHPEFVAAAEAYMKTKEENEKSKEQEA